MITHAAWVRFLIGAALVSVVAGSGVVLPIAPSTGINVGGALVPLLLAVVLTIANRNDDFPNIMIATAVMGIVAHILSDITKAGVGVSLLPVAVIAAAMAIVIGAKRPAAVAFIAATLGVLLGSDVANLHAVPSNGDLVIGGAGLDDAVLLIGPLAAIFAASVAQWLRKPA